MDKLPAHIKGFLIEWLNIKELRVIRQLNRRWLKWVLKRLQYHHQFLHPNCPLNDDKDLHSNINWYHLHLKLYHEYVKTSKPRMSMLMDRAATGRVCMLVDGVPGWQPLDSDVIMDIMGYKLNHKNLKQFEGYLNRAGSIARLRLA